MKTLAIETSGKTFGLALAENGKIVREVFENSGFIHSEKLVPQINRLLKSAGWNFKSLDKIAVSTGPGSFTGIRVGLTCAKVLGQVLNIPVVSVDTLSLLCKTIPEGDYTVIAVIDAGRGEVYVKGKTIEIMEAERYFSWLKKNKKKLLIVGNAVINYNDVISRLLRGKALKTPEKYIYPRAGALAVLADKLQGSNFSRVKPLYIRKSWAEEKANTN